MTTTHSSDRTMFRKKSIVHLDEERKAQMVSNLLVVLCSERDAAVPPKDE